MSELARDATMSEPGVRAARPRPATLLGVAAALLVARGARRVDAFFPTNLRTLGGIQGHSHTQITRDALAGLDEELFGVQTPTGSMLAATEEVVDANVHVDDDQLHSALHFDGENFVAGQGRLLGLKQLVIAAAQQNDAQGARQSLGEALHSIQDFYAHSNWTNHTAGVNEDLGVEGRQLQNTLGINEPAEVSGALTTKLTSGYYHGEDRSPPTSIQTGHKDRHGGLTDTLSPFDFGLGLNRDSNNPEFSPEALLHEVAASLAGTATQKYIREILDQLTIEQRDLLLGKGPTLGIVIDTTSSMGPEIDAVRTAAIQLVDDRLGTKDEPSQYVLGQILDPETPAPFVTARADEFKAAIAALTPRPHAVDCPELAMGGTLQALGAMDEGGEMFVWTDASAKDAALAGAVSALARAKHVRVDFTLTGSCSPIDPAYVQIANDTGGQLFVLTEAQAAAAAALPSLVVGATSVHLLSVRDAVASGSKDYAVPVDPTLTEVTFAADTDAMQVRRPNAQPVQAGDPDAAVVQLAGGATIATGAVTSGSTVVKVTSPAPGTWTVTMGASPAYRLEVSGAGPLDLSRFRFVQAGGRDGHEGVVSLAGLPVGGASTIADALLVGAFSTARFDLRRPDGTPLQDLALTAVPDAPAGEFAGNVVVPGEPFLAYVTGQDAGGNAFQRVSAEPVQPQTVSVAPPMRQALHPGVPTTYVFSVANAGAADTFALTAEDARGFVASGTPTQASIPTGGAADFTVVLQPPATAMLGSSDVLTVRASSTGTPGLENFASLTSVVAPIEVPTTTSTTTTTLPCTTPRCTIDAALHGAACASASVPGAIVKKLDRALTLLDRADATVKPKVAHRLDHQAKQVLTGAGKAARKAAKGRKPKLAPACAATIREAAATVAAGL